MEKKKTCFYLACLTVCSLAAMMVWVLVYKFAYFNVYGIDITHYIGFNEVLVSSVVPWLRFMAFILILILTVLYYKYFFVPYLKYKKENRAGREKNKLAQWWDNLMNRFKTKGDDQAKERMKVRREKLHALHYHSFFDLIFFGLFLILSIFIIRICYKSMVMRRSAFYWLYSSPFSCSLGGMSL